MQQLVGWKSVLTAMTCSMTTVMLVITLWNFKKKSVKDRKEAKSEHRSDEKINISEKMENEADSENTRNEEDLLEEDFREQLPEPVWVKVGKIEKLYFYPLKSGRGKEIEECVFTVSGISIVSDGLLTLRDRMFLVYSEEKKRFKTGRNYPTLILVTLSAVDENKIKLEAVGMPTLIFQVPDNSSTDNELIECSMWWGESVKCLDCGPAAAEWISRFLTGTSSGLRLGFASKEHREIQKSPWEKYTKVYENLRSQDMGLFSDLTSYMLLTTRSIEAVNEQLNRPVPALQFRPNILVSSDTPFEEDDWEWIKLGQDAIIRNVKPCPRCNMVRIDPETGIADKDEPLKTLRSFREQKDPKKVAVDGKAPILGINCGLYRRGNVKVGDDVFVHFAKSANK